MVGKGCKECRHTGYAGRTGIFEFLKVTPAIQDLIVNKASADEIARVAKQEGMRTLREGVIEKLLTENPENCEKLIGTGIIEEDYFEQLS